MILLFENNKIKRISEREINPEMRVRKELYQNGQSIKVYASFSISPEIIEEYLILNHHYMDWLSLGKKSSG